jgi:TolA-binding protein
MASISTTTEVSKPEDGVLTVQGGEVVEIVYVEQADSKGASNIKHVASMRIVSSAVLAVMDGAYRQNVKGVFADNPAFLRLKDIDLDITSGKDSVKVSVKSFRKRQKKEDGAADAFEADEDPWEEVASGEVVLTETADRNGVFEGRVIPVLSMISGEGQIEAASDGKLVISYRDERHINGSVPREVMAEVAVLTGGSTEPQSIVSSAADPVMQCRKLLLEAKLLNQWGTIFKDVGLDKQAAQKANEGLERVDEIFSLAKRFALPRDILENTYAAKWDLYMVKGELRRAIGVCRDLLKKYPDTVLADVALLKIAKARSESRELSEIKESASIYRSVLSMPNSRNKPEAQFLLAGVLEKLAKVEAVQRRRIKDKLEPDYTAAILAYRACAENYPQSSFAGESFKRIVTFQIGKRDYDRANETLERVFQDYPDAPWLDEMLLRWGIVKYRTGDVEGAKAKFRRILEEYPAGPASSQAQNFLQKLNR